MPRPSRVPIGKRSHRTPYDMVTRRLICHWSFRKKLYEWLRVVLRLLSKGMKLFCSAVARPRRKVANELYWLAEGPPRREVGPPSKVNAPALAPVSKRLRPYWITSPPKRIWCTPLFQEALAVYWRCRL